jgi:hypothetical protein
MFLFIPPHSAVSESAMYTLCREYPVYVQVVKSLLNPNAMIIEVCHPRVDPPDPSRSTYTHCLKYLNKPMHKHIYVYTYTYTYIARCRFINYIVNINSPRVGRMWGTHVYTGVLNGPAMATVCQHTSITA